MKETLSGDRGVLNEATFSVSLEEMLGDLRPLGGPNVGPRIDMNVSGRTRNEEKVLKVTGL